MPSEISVARSAQRLGDMLDRVLYMLAHIRYRTWPQRGLGIGLEVEELDVLIRDCEHALNSAKRNKLWKKQCNG